jgi:hypothetical protein
MPGVPNFLANLPFSGEDPQSLVAEISNLGMSAPTLPQNCLEETIIYTLDQIISWPNILRKKINKHILALPNAFHLSLPGTSRMSSR